jgi:CD109 antigen
MGEAHNKLMGMAKEDEDGLHWGNDTIEPFDSQEKINPGIRMPVDINHTSQVEATAYAALALVKHGDSFNSSRAAKWLVSRRNAFGGYGSTQDTVVTLQALTEYATDTRADVDLTVTVKGNDFEKVVRITQQNFDVLQMIEVKPNQQVEISASGKGEVIGQVVSRYNIPDAERPEDEILKVDVDYDATQIEVDDLINISVKLAFNPPIPMEAGMVVLDVSVPTGFSPVTETITQVLEKEGKIKRYDISGRKVIFYVENMQPGDVISFDFDARALYPVKAKGVASVAYSYYKPEIRGETLSEDVIVR